MINKTIDLFKDVFLLAESSLKRRIVDNYKKIEKELKEDDKKSDDKPQERTVGFGPIYAVAQTGDDKESGGCVEESKK